MSLRNSSTGRDPGEPDRVLRPRRRLAALAGRIERRVCDQLDPQVTSSRDTAQGRQELSPTKAVTVLGCPRCE